MPKILQFSSKDRNGKTCNIGRMEIKNQTEQSSDLYFFGDIVSDEWGKWTDEDKCPSDIVNFLRDLDGTQNINVHINSGGGSVWGGIAIYNQLKRHQASVTVYVDGLAASIASIIAMAGDRIVMPVNAMLMIHKPSNGYCYTMLNADQLRKDADTLDAAQNTLLATYLSKIKDGVSAAQITDMINAETWLTATEAAQYFDIEVEGEGEAVACTSQFFHEYKHVPAAFSVQNENTEKQLDMDELADILIQKIAEKENEKIKNSILEDLSRYGA